MSFCAAFQQASCGSGGEGAGGVTDPEGAGFTQGVALTGADIASGTQGVGGAGVWHAMSAHINV